MPIQFKSKLSSTVANATFLDKTIDDLKKGKLSLFKVDVSETQFIDDLQVMVNAINSDLGRDGEVDPLSNTYSSEEIISNGDNRKVAIGKLDAQVDDNLDTINSHAIILIDHESRISTNETEIQSIEDSVGQANGIAPLGASTKIDAAYLPSYVDDVEEYADLASFPATGEAGKIYIALDTNKTYRWSGSVYVEVSPNDVNSVNGQTGIVVLGKTDIGLTDVTNDAQLKREASDFNSFSEKSEPVIDDIVLIEDSEDSFNKKKVKLSNMLGGGGEGGINYTLNSDAESDITNHNLYKNAAQEIPVDAIGGIPTISLTQDSVNNIAGDSSFNLLKPASNAQGEGVNILSRDFDKTDQGKILIISIEKDASDANYNDGDIRCYFKDNTNGTIIRINGEDVLGGKSTHYARVQVPIDCENGSIILHIATDSVDSFNFIYDRVSLSPQVISQGAIVTNDKDYSPVILGFGTTTGLDFKYHQVGEYLQLTASFTSGISTAVEAQIPLPENLSIRSGLPITKVGDSAISNANTSTYITLLATGGDNFLNVGATTSTSGGLVPRNGNALISSGQGLSFTALIPIQGWSSQANMSSDFGGREIIVSGEGNSGAVIDANTERIDFTKVLDSTGSWVQNDNGTDTFVSPESKYYNIFGSVFSSTAETNWDITAYVDGLPKKSLGYNNASTVILNFSGSVFLEKGQALDLRSSNTFTLSNNSRYHWVEILGKNNPQTNLESETIACRYTSDSGQSINPSGNGEVIVFEDKDYDTHSIYNSSTGLGVIPKSGFYKISGMWDAFINDQEAQIVYISINGTVKDRIVKYGSRSIAQGIRIEGTFKLEKGDTFEIFADTSGTTFSLSTNSVLNTMSVARIK